MAKKGKETKALDRAQQKLAKAQLTLHVAQEKRAQAISRGEQEIERARQHAATREQKATTRVEKRAAAVARAEAVLFKLTDKSGPSRRGAPAKLTPAVVGAETSTPETAAEVLEREMPREEIKPIIIPDSVEIVSGNENQPLNTDTHNPPSSTW